MMASGEGNLSDAIFGYAEERPDAAATIEAGTTLSYGVFARYVAQATSYLEAEGVAPGDRVAVMMVNGIDHFILVFALFRRGAVVVEVPAHRDGAIKADLVERYGVRHVFCDADGAAPAGVASVHRVPFGWRRRLDALPAGGRHDGGDAAAVVRLSSGSTATPRGRLLSHRELLRLYGSEAGLAFIGVVSPDRPCCVLIALSIGFAGFFGAALAAVLAGSTVVWLPKYTVPAEMARAIASWPDAVLPATPQMSQSLIATAVDGDLLCPGLRAVVSMGQRMHPHQKRLFVERVTPNLYDTYGAAGFGLVAYLGPHDMVAKGHTVGLPIDGIEVEIVDGAGVQCPPGRIGRVRVRRPGEVPIFEGADAASPLAAEGWVDTGDLGQLDADGYVEIKGRTTELMNRRGVEIFTPELEEALASHPRVREVAVVGVEKPGSQVDLVAFIVRSGALEHDELCRHCAALLPAERLPDSIVYIGALPRLGTGKVDQARLKDLARGQR
jgi:acyl-CoA synthetase (AMP-forming)/AMP-acid ligase II